jgi:4-methylaminobutanoate oxidase (formaldehyde-forming)
MTLPSRAGIIVIGGGIIGCSVAYHLARLELQDVVLLERRKLGCGTTWHSVGSVGELRGSPLATELARYTINLLRELEQETGQATGLKQPGSIMLALNRDRLVEMKRTVSMAHALGLDAEIIDRQEIARRCAHVKLDDVLAGMWIPTDGRVNALDTALAYAKGARQRGARIFEEVSVESLIVENGEVRGVTTAEGPIRAEAVALCTGLWSRPFAARHGVALPLHAAEHFYAVTEPVAGLPSPMPMIRVPDESTYYKDDAGKLLFGCLERRAKPWGMAGIPEGFCFDSLPADLDHFDPILAAAMDRFPLLRETGIRLFFNGPETFTPDGNALLGETPELRNLFVACGMNTVGVISSGSVGKILAEWIRDRRAPAGFVDVDVRRTLPFQAGDRFLYDRTVEALGILYDMGWPNREYASARGARRSALHRELLDVGAVMGERAGSETPLVFAPAGVPPAIEYGYGRPNWAPWCAAECRAAAARAALFDESCQAKILIQGEGAGALLDRVSAHPMDMPVSGARSTFWLNEQGRIVAMPTVVRLAPDRFLVLTAPGSQRRDADWLRRQGAAAAGVAVVDVSSAWTLLRLVGPRAAALVSAAADGQAPAEGSIAIGYAPAIQWDEPAGGLAGRCLLLPSEFAAHAFETLREAGRDLGLACAGGYAARSLRIEAGEAAWGIDIDDTVSPSELGISLPAAGGRDFVGRSALEVTSPGKRLVRLIVRRDEHVPLFRQEPILADDKVVGITSSGAFGYRMERPVALGWISDSSVLAGPVDLWEVEAAGERLPVELAALPG